MLQAIKEDLFRYQGTDCTKISVLLSYLYKPHTRYMWYFRQHQFASNKFCRLFWKVLLLRAKFKTGVQIPAGTRIGRGFRMLHFGNVVVHPRAIIGDNCNIAEGVLVGESFLHGTCGVPTIDNNCCLFANSIVLGGIKVGDDVLIAPGAFVNFDVPDNCIVMGNPGKIIQRETSPTKKYIVFPVLHMK